MIKAGDLIRHTTTGNLLMVVYCDGAEVIPDGPLRWINIKDVKLMQSCSDEDHIKYLNEWAKWGSDIRKTRCIAILKDYVYIS